MKNFFMVILCLGDGLNFGFLVILIVFFIIRFILNILFIVYICSYFII